MLTNCTAWIRVIFCSGPRQVVNAVTLYSVYTAKLEVDGKNFESSLESLFDKIKALAQQDYQQALILSGMLFTLIIWVFSALSFILACLFYVTFLWGWIPKQDGGLSGYCERKINKRLMAIVSKKVEAALADQEKQRKKAELKAAKKAGALPPEERKATLPTLMPEKSDKPSDMPPLFRNDTVATLPAYTSRPGTPGQGDQFEMNKLPPMPTRTNTNMTTSSRAPLLGAGADMGVSTPNIPSPMYGPARSGTMNSARGPYGPPGPNRTLTSNSNLSGSPNGPLQPSRIQTDGFNFGGPPRGPPQLRRTQTGTSGYDSSYDQPYYLPGDSLPAMPPPVRSPTTFSNNYYGMPPQAAPGAASSYDDYYNPTTQMESQSAYDEYPSTNYSGSPARYMTPGPMYDEYSAEGRASPAPSRQIKPIPAFNESFAIGRASPAPSRQMDQRAEFDDYFSRDNASSAPSGSIHQRLPSSDSVLSRASPAPTAQMDRRPTYNEYSSGGRASPAVSRKTNRRSTYYSSTGPVSPISTHQDSYPMPNEQPSTPVKARPAFTAHSPPSPSLARGQGSNPTRSFTSQVVPETPFNFSAPQRSMTAPVARQHSRQNSEARDQGHRPGTSYSQRSLTTTPPRQSVQSHYPRYGSAYTDLESQSGTPGPQY